MAPLDTSPKPEPTRNLLWKGASRLLVAIAVLVIIVLIIGAMVMRSPQTESVVSGRSDTDRVSISTPAK